MPKDVKIKPQATPESAGLKYSRPVRMPAYVSRKDDHNYEFTKQEIAEMKAWEQMRTTKEFYRTHRR